MRIAFAVFAASMLSGCVGTLVDVVTLPVRAASSAVDAVTTSQSEADEKRGRELRKQEERDGKAARKRAKRERDARDD